MSKIFMRNTFDGAGNPTKGLQSLQLTNEVLIKEVSRCFPEILTQTPESLTDKLNWEQRNAKKWKKLTDELKTKHGVKLDGTQSNLKTKIYRVRKVIFAAKNPNISLSDLCMAVDISLLIKEHLSSREIHGISDYLYKPAEALHLIVQKTLKKTPRDVLRKALRIRHRLVQLSGKSEKIKFLEERSANASNPDWFFEHEEESSVDIPPLKYKSLEELDETVRNMVGFGGLDLSHFNKDEEKNYAIYSEFLRATGKNEFYEKVEKLQSNLAKRYFIRNLEENSRSST